MGHKLIWTLKFIFLNFGARVLTPAGRSGGYEQFTF